MCIKNKVKIEEKSEIQEAYKYGITVCKEIVSDFFLGKNISQEDVNRLLQNLENCKSIDYPPRCGTCGAILKINN